MACEVWTYFILDPLSGDIKIGISKAPSKRIREMQTGVSRTLILIGAIEGNAEAELHERFSDHRQNGQWFSPCAELMSYILTEAPMSIDKALRKKLAKVTPLHMLDRDRLELTTRMSNPIKNLEESDSQQTDIDNLDCEWWSLDGDKEQWLPGPWYALNEILDRFAPDETEWCAHPDNIALTLADAEPGEYPDGFEIDDDCECPNCCWNRAVDAIEGCDIVTRVGVNADEGLIVLILKPINSFRRKEQLRSLASASCDLDFVGWCLYGFGTVAYGYGQHPGQNFFYFYHMYCMNLSRHRLPGGKGDEGPVMDDEMRAHVQRAVQPTKPNAT
jgi:hypothetical protein